MRSNFDAEFAAHCRDIKRGRVAGEKALQSFLIRDAYTHGPHMAVINAASNKTTDPVELIFVTDEIALPAAGDKIMCDLLALRRDGGRSTPVLLELKDARMRKRLVEQVEGYSTLVDEHADLFAVLYRAIVGEQPSTRPRRSGLCGPRPERKRIDGRGIWRPRESVWCSTNSTRTVTRCMLDAASGSRSVGGPEPVAVGHPRCLRPVASGENGGGRTGAIMGSAGTRRGEDERWRGRLRYDRRHDQGQLGSQPGSNGAGRVAVTS